MTIPPVKQRVLFIYVFVLAAALFAAHSVSALDRVAALHAGDASERALEDLLTKAEGGGWHHPRRPLILTAKVPGAGTVSFAFSKLKKQQWPASFHDGRGRVSDPVRVALLQGRIVRGRTIRHRAPTSSRVAAAIFLRDSNYSLRFDFQGATTRGAARFFHLSDREHHGIVTPALRMSRTSRFALAGKTCDGAKIAAPVRVSGAGAARSFPMVTAATRTIKIDIRADHKFYQTFGSLSNAEIASMLNTVDAIYTDELGINFSIVSSTVYQSAGQFPYPYTSTGSMGQALQDDVAALLNKFQSVSLGESNQGDAVVHHFIFDRDLTSENSGSGTAGYGYVGVVCESLDYAYGISEYISSSITPILLAHEVGHNLGAIHTEQHDPNNHTGIMAQVLSNPLPSIFAQVSKDDVAAQLDDNDSCLALVTGTPTPTPTPEATPPAIALSTRLSKKAFRATMTVAQLADGCTIRLRAAKQLSGAQSGKVVTEFTPAALTTTLKVTVDRKVRADGSDPKLYVVAQHKCSGGSAFSTTKPLSLSKPKVSAATSISGWIKRLKQLLAL